MRPNFGDTVPATLGGVLDEVRWDFDPAQRLVSPLVAAARYFEEFPWDGEPEDEPAETDPAALRPG